MNALLESINGTSYKDKINFIGFPCNQFAHQEPAKNTTELKNGLKYVRPGDGYKPAVRNHEQNWRQWGQAKRRLQVPKGILLQKHSTPIQSM